MTYKSTEKFSPANLQKYIWSANPQKNLAKFKRGKHGSGLDDIDIEELDWVSKETNNQYLLSLFWPVVPIICQVTVKLFVRLKTTRKWKQWQSWSTKLLCNGRKSRLKKKRTMYKWTKHVSWSFNKLVNECLIIHNRNDFCHYVFCSTNASPPCRWFPFPHCLQYTACISLIDKRHSTRDWPT